MAETLLLMVQSWTALLLTQTITRYHLPLLLQEEVLRLDILRMARTTPSNFHLSRCLSTFLGLILIQLTQ